MKNINKCGVLLLKLFLYQIDKKVHINFTNALREITLSQQQKT